MRTRQRLVAIVAALVLGGVASGTAAFLTVPGATRPSSPAGFLAGGIHPLGREPATSEPAVGAPVEVDVARAPNESERVEGSFIVDLAEGLDPKTAAAEVARDYGGSAALVYDAVIGGFEFRGPDDAARRMADDPRVSGVDANYVVHTADTLTHITQVNAPAAHSVGATGEGIRIAILDTGIRTTQAIFTGKVATGYAGCVGESSTSDNNGHGTATASQAGGTHGVAPGATLVPIKVFPGSGTSTDWAKVACGINHAKQQGYEVINMSLSGGSPTQALQDAVNQAAAGAVLVAAAGNSGGSVGYPAAYSNVIAVSGFEGTNKLASWSNRGSAIDIAAPGANICSADISQGSGDCSSHMSPDKVRSGTSRASPQVAGAAAILRGEGVPLAQVDDFLKHGGDCPNGPNTGPGNCPSGTWSGDSSPTEPFLDVKRSLDLATATLDPLPTGSFINPSHNEVVAGDQTIQVDAADDDTAESALLVQVKIGSGVYQPTTWNAISGYHELAWDTAGSPEGTITLSAQITDPTGGGTTTITRTAIVDNVDSPPSVSWVSPTNNATVSASFTARVNASDDSGTPTVTLSVDDGAPAPMTCSSGQCTRSVGPLSSGAHTLKAIATDGAAQTTQMQITVNVVNSFYSQKFDSAGGTGWTVSGSSQLWHISSKCGAARSLNNGVYYGRDATCKYDNGASNNGYVTTPNITGLPSSYKLTVSSKRKVESCACSRDQTYIEVSYNNGSSWTRIYYKDARNASSGVWETLSFTLGSSSSSSVKVRFRFYTGGTNANGYFGWAIDDFLLAP